MESRNASYLNLWRWHFYAGLVVTPFILLLSVTGAIYLFRPYYEAWRYHSLYQVQGAAPSVASLSPDSLIHIAEREFPGRKATQYISPSRPGRSAVVNLSAPPVQGSGGWTGKSGMHAHAAALEPIDVYLDPAEGRVLGHLVPQRMFMNRIFHLHGELLMGKPGSMVVELAACWTLVLLITGFSLWWPKQARFTLWGVFLPRLRAGGRIFRKDLHSVTGVYILVFLAGFLLSGMPWTQFWGGQFAKVQERIGQAWPAGKFFNPYTSAPAPGLALLSVDSVAVLAAAKGIPPGYSIELPKGPEGAFLVRSRMGSLDNGTNPADGRMLVLDAYRGNAIREIGWENVPALARAVDIGVRLHQGEYLGWPNLLAALLTAMGAILVSISGIWMWWKRRPAGGLGAPRPPEEYRYPKTVLALLVTAGLLFPLFGLSLVLVCAAEVWNRRRATA